MTTFTVIDYYEGSCEVIYDGLSYQACKRAIKSRIWDTSGECDLSIDVMREVQINAVPNYMHNLPLEEELENYYFDTYEECMASL